MKRINTVGSKVIRKENEAEYFAIGLKLGTVVRYKKETSEPLSAGIVKLGDENILT